MDDFLKSGSVLKSGYYDEPLSVGGVWYNGNMKTFKSDYLKHNKYGYYDNNKIKNDVLENILAKEQILKEDIASIKKHTNYVVEGAVVYNNGKRHEFNGNSIDRVEIPTKLLFGADIIHSHPLGTSFTVEDILEVVLEKSNSIVAFNDEYLYKFYNKIDANYDDLRSVIISVITDIDNLLESKIKNGTITKSQKDFAFNHKVWVEVAKKIKGFKYEAYKINKK